VDVKGDLPNLRVLTPGLGGGGELLHLLSSLERRSPRWDTDPDSARQSLSAAVSLVLRLLGRDPDPARSREHVLLSVLAERRLMAGESAELGALMADVAEPPVADIGALPINRFMKKTERQNLAAALNSLLASPTFASWREGVPLDVADWLTPKNGRTPGVIVTGTHHVHPMLAAAVSTPQATLLRGIHPPPHCRSRNSTRYSLRASGRSRAPGSNQCSVRADATIGRSPISNSGFSGHRECQSA
jgi:hypothetical protein